MIKLSYCVNERNNSLSGANAPLGILQNVRPTASFVASQPSTSNENQEKLCGFSIESDLSDSLILRYVRQSAARSLLPNNRVGWCNRRVREGENPALLKNLESSRAHWGGLMSCGKPWECPVCAAKVSQRRRDDLSLCVTQHRKHSGFMMMITFTFAHSKHDDLALMMKLLEKAWTSLIASRDYKAIKKDYGFIGTVRALEITYGQNGWHPHYHLIVFAEKRINHIDAMLDIRQRIFEVWLKQCEKKGLGLPSAKHGIDVRDASYVASYASKWGIEDELTKFSAKTARNGGLSPFQLLSEYIDGDKQAGALFIEFVKVFSGKRQLCFSRGLRKHFDLQNQISDEELVAVQDSVSVVLSTFTMEQWAFILKSRSKKHDYRAEILRFAELEDGAQVVNVFLNSLDSDLFPISFSQ